LVAAMLVGGAARAQAPVGEVCSPVAPTGLLGVNTNRTGLVDLYFFNAGGAAVTYYECIGGRGRRLGVASVADHSTTRFSVPWVCDRLQRHFAATVTLADGTRLRGVTGVRTMSCADRFALTVSRRVGLGREARIRVVDRWGIGGIRTRMCFTAPAGRRQCRTVGFAPAVTIAVRRLRLGMRGDWRVELQVRRYRLRATIAVGVKGVGVTVRPVVLATGDSTMQGVESFLADDLASQAMVVSEVHPGLGISSVAWTDIAASQVARLAPATTVISLGAAEGFPMRVAGGGTVTCCGEAWVAEYARRVRATMVIYRRHGRGRVFYLTIAAPRKPEFVPVVAAVNEGIIRAGVGLVGVRVLRMDLLFSPHGYQETIRYHGRDVAVREPDGVHLNVSGTAIEARETAKALRGG
jgi:hypothetical protein